MGGGKTVRKTSERRGGIEDGDKRIGYNGRQKSVFCPQEA